VTLSNTPGSAKDPEGPAAGVPSRDELVADLVDEMTSWNPRERMDAFRSWLKGSLSLVHLHVLSVVEADGPLPMSHLAEMLDVSVASATGIVDRMEERGLVERGRSETDRRIVLVHVTEAGSAIFRDLTEHRRRKLTDLLGRLGDDELAGLLAGLRAMRAARQALRVEETASGLVAVSVVDAKEGSDA
jgi:DNA-binding MarR family transcriptional regulator